MYLYQLVAPGGCMSHSCYIPHDLLAMRGESKCEILKKIKKILKKYNSKALRIQQSLSHHTELAAFYKTPSQGARASEYGLFFL